MWGCTRTETVISCAHTETENVVSVNRQKLPTLSIRDNLLNQLYDIPRLYFAFAGYRIAITRLDNPLATKITALHKMLSDFVVPENAVRKKEEHARTCLTSM